LAALLPLIAYGAETVRSSAERRQSFNLGWKFFKGEAAGAEAPRFQDASRLAVAGLAPRLGD